MGWKEITTEKISFEDVGMEVTGRLMAKGEAQMTSGTVGTYVLQTAEGDKSFLGTTQLDRALAGVQLGELVRIVYQGQVKTTQGRRMKTFQVLRWEPDKVGSDEE